MSKWTIYHNPKCSKSRQALAYLQEKGIQPEVIEYLKAPPTEDELRDIANKLKGPVSSMVRMKEDLFQSSKFDSNSVDEVVRHLAKEPVLIERPIVIKDNVAVVARPTELIDQI